VSEPPKIDEQELDSIRDLLKDFAFSPSITPEFVYREAWKRYTVLSNQLPYLQNYLGVLNHEWPKTLHYFIYRSLFRFAGSYRSTLDPGNGRVGFGGVKAQKHTHTFEGYHPDKIESEEEELAFIQSFRELMRLEKVTGNIVFGELHGNKRI
jgi:hypothetical protein